MYPLILLILLRLMIDVDIVIVVVVVTILLPILSRQEIDQKEVDESKELEPSRVGVHEPVIDGPSPPAWSACFLFEIIDVGSSSGGGQGKRGRHSGHDDGSGSG